MLRHLSTLRNWITPDTARAGWIAWVIFAVVVAVISIGKVKTGPTGVQSAMNSVTGNYWGAAHAWVEGRPLYAPGADGWLYPPQGLMVFLPYIMLPLKMAEPLWRLSCIALAAWAMWRSTRLLHGLIVTPSVGHDLLRSPCRFNDGRTPSAAPFDLFFVASLLAIPACAGSAQNGQTNLPLAAAIVLACVAAGERRWWACAAWCVLGLIFKPLMLVPILLLGVLCWRPLGWRLIIGLGVFAALPLLHTDTHYAIEQYAQGIKKVQEAGDFRERDFANLDGALKQIGIHVPELVMTGMRLACAGLTLLLCLLAAGRMGLARGAVAVLSLSCAYLMLMNPRTEGVSYCILGLAVASWGAWQIGVRRDRSLGVFAMIAAFVLVAAHVISGPLTGRTSDLVLRPLVALVFFGIVVVQIIRDRWLITR